MIAAVNSQSSVAAAPALPAREEIIRAHYRLQFGRFFTAVDFSTNGIHAASDLSAPMWNHSMWLDGQLPQFIEEVEAWHDKQARRPVLYVAEAGQPLRVEGYEPFDRETWMVRDVGMEESASDFRIEPATDLAEYAKIFREAFSIRSSGYEEALKRESAGQIHLVARDGAGAVAVGTVAFEAELACIYNVGTLPAARGRGAGRAMMEALVAAAREEGCRWVFLQVESGSKAERLYSKLGFEPVFTRLGYHKMDWAAPRPRPLLTSGQRDQILNVWSRGGEIVWNGQSISHLIEETARRAPTAIATLLADGARQPQWTYAELMACVARRACDLIRQGVTPGAHVGVLLPRSMEVAASILAIWRAGGVFVPMDASYPADRLAYMAADTRMKVVITDKSLAGAGPKGVPRLLVDGPQGVETGTAVHVEPGDPAYVIYTSGSTGQPKGVTISHGAIARHALAMADYYKITPGDRHLHFSPFTFDASFEQLLPPLVAGATVVIRDEKAWDVNELIRNLKSLQLSIVDLPTAYWGQLAAAAEQEKIPGHLRLVIVGGEAMPLDTLRRWQRGSLAHCRLVNAYGPTEATVTATAFEASAFHAIGASSRVPIGRPLPGRLAYILDELLEPAPVCVTGELYIGGPLLASGYLNRPDLTRERFIPNPFAPGKLYKTGDQARYLPDGSIEFLGRADDQVKIRGFRVELGEIEAALQENPAVRETAVIARDDQNGSKRLVAYVTLRDKATSERELRAWFKGRLPDYMTPSVFVVLKEFPLLNSGKINRKALPEPAVESVAPSSIPTTPLELQLQILFQRVLRRTGVGVDESFFEMGGDSLQALELIVQIEKATGRRLPMETLFQTPSIRGVSGELQKAAHDRWSCLAPLQKSGVRPPLFLVHTTPGDVLGYGNLIHHLGSEQPCYGFQALGLNGSSEPHDSIEAMAAHYVELLKEFQPRGPYILGGWCFGGIVAVEMAQQLQAGGDEVAALLLMETISMSPGLRYPRYHFERFKRLLEMSLPRWRDYLRAKARYRKQVEMDNRMRFWQAGENIDTAQRKWLERLERVYNANLAALDRYRQRYYAGKVTLFNALERDPGILPDPNYGWAGLADAIETYEVAGNHDTMLAEPNVSSLAEAIRKTLSKL